MLTCHYQFRADVEIVKKSSKIVHVYAVDNVQNHPTKDYCIA